ncbi:MAG: hypothetical protein AAF125_24890, partial [Chloroflexota bacterium]
SKKKREDKRATAYEELHEQRILRSQWALNWLRIAFVWGIGIMIASVAVMACWILVGQLAGELLDGVLRFVGFALAFIGVFLTGSAVVGVFLIGLTFMLEKLAHNIDRVFDGR